MSKFHIIVGLILIVNIYSFALIGYDKRKAKKNEWRVPEKRFFTLAFLCGAIGIYVGMKYFRHKTKHSHFIYGVPFIILLNLAFFYILFFKI